MCGSSLWICFFKATMTKGRVTRASEGMPGGRMWTEGTGQRLALPSPSQVTLGKISLARWESLHHLTVKVPRGSNYDFWHKSRALVERRKSPIEEMSTSSTTLVLGTIKACSDQSNVLLCLILPPSSLCSSLQGTWWPVKSHIRCRPSFCYPSPWLAWRYLNQVPTTSQPTPFLILLHSLGLRHLFPQISS